MRINSFAALLALAVAIGLPGCKRSESATVEKSGDSGMAGMPGMRASEEDSGSMSRDTVTLSAAQMANARVTMERPTATAIASAVEVPGQILVNEDRTARIAAPARARALTVHVSPGDRVNLGKPLVTLQSQEASMALADVSKAEAEAASRKAGAAYAKAALDRAERLLALKSIARQEYERAIADDELARAALSQAEAELRRARASAEQLSVDPQTGAMEIRSPVAGVVVSREVVPGSVVEAGAALVTVTDPSTLWLTVALPEQYASGVRPGSELRFTVPAFPNDTFLARVQSVSAAFDPATRTLPVRGTVANGAGRLRPEMFAKVWVQGGAREVALSVPDSALQRVNGKTVVFVGRSDTKGGTRFEKREVRIAASSGGRATILSGVFATDAVVVRGAFAVKAELAKRTMPKMEM